MSSLRPQDRRSLCRFSFADGRQCRTPRAGDKLACELSYFLSGQCLSACDLSSTLGRLLPAVVRGDIKPRSARTLAYLSQTLAQTIHLSKREYINAFGSDSWRRAIRNSVRQNFNYLQPSPPPQPPPDQTPHVIAGLQTGGDQAPPPRPAPQPALSPRTPLPPTSTEFAQHVEADLHSGTSVPQPTPNQNQAPTSTSTDQPNPEAIRQLPLVSAVRVNFLFLDSASSASLHNSAIIVFLLFSRFAFSRFRQESPSNNTLPNPFKCNTYKPSRKCQVLIPNHLHKL